MVNDIMTDLLNTVDVKISANSRSFNVDVHCYEHWQHRENRSSNCTRDLCDGRDSEKN